MGFTPIGGRVWRQTLQQRRQGMTHAPPWQTRAPEHGPPLPHWQLPALEQLSPAMLSAQSTHERPALPHVVMERVRHVEPSQHPDGHEPGLQTQLPPLHA